MFNDMMLVCCLKYFLIICCVRLKRKDIYDAAYIFREGLFQYKVIFAITFYSESIESIFVCKSFYYHPLHITYRKHFSMIFCIPCGYFSVEICIWPDLLLPTILTYGFYAKPTGLIFSFIATLPKYSTSLIKP